MAFEARSAWPSWMWTLLRTGQNPLAFCNCPLLSQTAVQNDSQLRKWQASIPLYLNASTHWQTPASLPSSFLRGGASWSSFLMAFEVLSSKFPGWVWWQRSPIQAPLSFQFFVSAASLYVVFWAALLIFLFKVPEPRPIFRPATGASGLVFENARILRRLISDILSWFLILARGTLACRAQWPLSFSSLEKGLVSGLFFTLMLIVLCPELKQHWQYILPRDKIIWSRVVNFLPVHHHTYS